MNWGGDSWVNENRTLWLISCSLYCRQNLSSSSSWLVGEEDRWSSLQWWCYLTWWNELISLARKTEPNQPLSSTLGISAGRMPPCLRRSWHLSDAFFWCSEYYYRAAVLGYLYSLWVEILRGWRPGKIPVSGLPGEVHVLNNNNNNQAFIERLFLW